MTRSGGRSVIAAQGARGESGRNSAAAPDRTRTASRAIRNNTVLGREPTVRRHPVNVPRFNNHYGRNHRAEYSWCTHYHHPGHYHYASSRVHVSSHIFIGVRWPWQVRYHRHWAPRYRYRQVIYVDAGWGGRRHSQRVDVRTTYRQRVIEASDTHARVRIDIESIELYQGDRYVGYVDQVPGNLARIEAVVYDDGYIEFDRNVFLIGDAYRGFEILSTRHYDDYLLSAWQRDHRLDVGEVDLRRGRVRNVGRSRLFNPYDFNGLVPISLLPEDDRLWDYGRDAISDNYDGYGYGDDRRYGDDWRYDLNRSDEIRYSTEAGVAVAYNRETILERID